MEPIEGIALFQQFRAENFDVKEFTTQSIHQGVGIAEQLAHLADGITVLDKHLKEHVCVHYEDLLSQVTAVETLEEVLKNMQMRIQALLSAVERVRVKVIDPYQKISNLTTKLSRMQSACDLLRCIARISNLSKRLQSQMQGGAKEIAKCAHTLSELGHVMEGVDLSGIDVMAKDQKSMHLARKEIEDQARRMLDQGIELQNQAQVATALQVFHYLGVLAEVLRQVTQEAQQNLADCVREALDLQSLSSSAGAETRGSTPGRAAMPTMGNAAAFKATLWNNVERLNNQIYAQCSRIQHLQKVLSKKRDPVTHRPFGEELVRTTDGGGSSSDCVTTDFWNSVTEILTNEFVRAANESTFVKQAFEEEYPKLLRLHGDLWRRLQQFSECGVGPVHGSATDLDQDENALPSEAGISSVKQIFDPETALRSTLSPFENAYLSRSLSRLFDPVNLMFTGGEAPPTSDEVKAALRVVTSELNVASVDARLAATVARNVTKTIQLFVSKCEQMLSTNGEASQVIGPATRGQLTNAAIIDLLDLYDKLIRQMLKDVHPNFPKEAVEIVLGSLTAVHDLMKTAIQPLVSSVEDAIESILLTMHDEDFSGSPGTAGDADQMATSTFGLPQCSLYMRELQDFVARVVVDYFSQIKCTSFTNEKMRKVAYRSLELFVRHAALVRPLGEGGKRRLAADCAQMELCLSPLCPQMSELGKPYRMLRAFRPTLFQTPEHIIQSSAVGDTLPYSTVLHVLFSRAPPEIRSPHQTADWSLAHFSKWLDDHPSEADRLELIKGALESYVNSIRQRQGKEFAPIYPVMLRALQNATQNLH